MIRLQIDIFNIIVVIDIETRRIERFLDYYLSSKKTS